MSLAFGIALGLALRPLLAWVLKRETEPAIVSQSLSTEQLRAMSSSEILAFFGLPLRPDDVGTVKIGG